MTVDNLENTIQLKKAFDVDKFYSFLATVVENNISLLDSIIDYSEKHGVDMQTVADLVKRNPKYKKLLLEEAQHLHMVK